MFLSNSEAQLETRQLLQIHCMNRKCFQRTWPGIVPHLHSIPFFKIRLSEHMCLTSEDVDVVIFIFFSGNKVMSC